MAEHRAGATVTSLQTVFVRTFLGAMGLSVVYFALSHWRVFNDPNWDIPGFLSLAAAMPWSTWWFSYHVSWATARLGVRNALTVLVIPLGFAVNCATVAFTATALSRKLKRAYGNNTVSNAS